MLNPKRILRKENGQALVEMALILPLLLLLLWGIVEFGRLGHAYLATTHAAREGARFGAVGMSDVDIVGEVNRRSATLPGGVTVMISPGQSNRFTGGDVEVQVDYLLTFQMPLMGLIIQNPFEVTAISVMRVE